MKRKKLLSVVIVFVMLFGLPTFLPDASLIKPTEIKASADDGAIPNNALEYNGHYYCIYNDSVNWDTAKLQCEALGGHLATITSSGEQGFIESININNRRLWIGGYRDDNYNWYWVTGEPWVYTNWDDGEPNNSSNVISNEKCVAIWPKYWNDLNNRSREQSGFICEWDPNLGSNPGTQITNNKTIKFSYGNYGMTARAYSFKYNDSLLVKNTDATKLNGDLAIAASNLAVAAYEKESIDSCLQQMGFDKNSIQDYGSYSFKPTYEDNDRVAFTIAYKKSNGKDLFIVPIRGTHGNCEWFSDFNLGIGENHEGFYKAAKRVKNALVSAFKNTGAETKNTVILFTGHSRGAAVANIIAGELCTLGISNEDNSLYYKLPEEQVFGYTYACPAVSKSKDLETVLLNIHNYINPGDIIPTLPLEKWGYMRYGNNTEDKHNIVDNHTNIEFSTNGDVYTNFLHRFYDFRKIRYEGEKSVKGVTSTLGVFIPKANEFNSGDLQFVFKYLSIKMMDDTPESILPCTQDELLDKLFNEYNMPLMFKSFTKMNELAIYLAPVFNRLNPFTTGVAFANLSDFISLFTSKGVAHAHTGETYVKWVEAMYGTKQTIVHSYNPPITVQPTFAHDGYTMEVCKKCGQIKTYNVTKFQNENIINNSLRVAGTNRFDTSVEISKQCYGYAETVVLASGMDYPDALAGVPLAQLYNSPILLTSKDSISNSVLAEISSLHTKRVIILGGTGAVSTKVEQTLLEKGLETVRISGSNRFETAAKVAQILSEQKKTDTVFFAYYNGFADALSVSHVAGILGAPVLYVAKDGDIDQATKKYLDSVKGNMKKAYIIGGTGVVSENMRNKIGSYLETNVERISGSNRYATCIAVNNTFNELLTGSVVCVATGKAFPDALAGGVLAAKTKSPLILADGVLDNEQKEYIKNHEAEIVCALGGIGAVSNELVEMIMKER